MSQFNAPTYEIARSSGACAITGRALTPGEAYIAALVETDASDPTPANTLGFKRLDISLDAWNQSDGKRRPAKVFAHWKAVVPEPNQKKKLFVDNDVLMNLLRRLADVKEPQRLAFRFVLALILMRKKMLRYDGTQKRQAIAQPSDPAAGAPVTCDATAANVGQTVEQEWWQMTPKLDLSKGPFGKWNEDEVIEVLDPHLVEAQIQQVTEQLNEILNAEL